MGRSRSGNVTLAEPYELTLPRRIPRRRWDRARPPGSAFRRRLICSPVLGIAAGEGCCREVRSWCCIGVGVIQIHPARRWYLFFYPTSCWKRKVRHRGRIGILSQVEGRPMPVSPIEIKGIRNVAAKDPVNQGCPWRHRGRDCKRWLLLYDDFQGSA